MIHFYDVIRHKNTLISLSVLFFLFTTLAVAHGPKGHDEMEFSAFMAIKKGVELYDRLITSDKLVESWEVDLDNLNVFKKPIDNQEVFVVKFSRSKGEPKSVYIFFSQKGEYRGSNFTGD